MDSGWSITNNIFDVPKLNKVKGIKQIIDVMLSTYVAVSSQVTFFRDFRKKKTFCKIY